MLEPLTDKQRGILEFIIKSKGKTGNTPTLMEIRSHFGFKAVGTVQDHLAVLRKKGYIDRSARARHIDILDNAGIESPSKDTIRLPIVGNVAAGKPILSEENLEGYMHIDKSFSRSRELFLLRVQGDSMIDAHIVDGDLVMVKQQDQCENGDIAVCLVEDEATVKRFFKRNRFIELRPENKSYKPIIVKPQNKFQLVGKVTGVIRMNP